MALDRRVRPLTASISSTLRHHRSLPMRSFATTCAKQVKAETTESSSGTAASSLPPSIEQCRNTVSTPRAERRLVRTSGQLPVGSRRRRAAIAIGGVPFSEQPYQCFQEARNFLQEDRKEKLETIRAQREQIRRLEATSVAPQDERKKETRLISLRKALHENIILADINDPLVKKKFEDGQVDMAKPIYRHLADQKWRSYERKLVMQRIEQMNVIPDVLPVIEPVVSTNLYFGRNKTPHGDFVDSQVSERAPRINIQCYDKGVRKVTIAVINADVPDVAKDGFTYRCHFLASNVEISPTNTLVDLGKLDEDSQVILPWLPAYVQKGLPYQRMCVFVLQQTPPKKPLETPTHVVNVKAIKEAGKYTTRDGFVLRSFVDNQLLTPVGADLFRSKWDENTAEVMQRAGITGWDIEFRRKRIEPLPYKRMDSKRYR